MFAELLPRLSGVREVDAQPVRKLERTDVLQVGRRENTDDSAGAAAEDHVITDHQAARRRRLCVASVGTWCRGKHKTVDAWCSADLCFSQKTENHLTRNSDTCITCTMSSRCTVFCRCTACRLCTDLQADPGLQLAAAVEQTEQSRAGDAVGARRHAATPTRHPTEHTVLLVAQQR